ncbi:MAG: hypothetical protein IT307_19905 [Chloroflexi bacterium]|nr:hypothetical protein [Chloroflexota bacterium]
MFQERCALGLKLDGLCYLFAAVVGVRQLVSTNRVVHEIILPAPTSILSVAPGALGERLFLVHLGSTLREIF